jgi:hypothetical protein
VGVSGQLHASAALLAVFMRVTGCTVYFNYANFSCVIQRHSCRCVCKDYFVLLRTVLAIVCILQCFSFCHLTHATVAIVCLHCYIKLTCGASNAYTLVACHLTGKHNVR